MPLKVISNLALTQQEAINEYSSFESLFWGQKYIHYSIKRLKKTQKGDHIQNRFIRERNKTQVHRQQRQHA